MIFRACFSCGKRKKRFLELASAVANVKNIFWSLPQAKQVEKMIIKYSDINRIAGFQNLQNYFSMFYQADSFFSS
jgi:hypothetical protein